MHVIFDKIYVLISIRSNACIETKMIFSDSKFLGISVLLCSFLVLAGCGGADRLGNQPHAVDLDWPDSWTVISKGVAHSDWRIATPGKILFEEISQPHHRGAVLDSAIEYKLLVRSVFIPAGSQLVAVERNDGAQVFYGENEAASAQGSSGSKGLYLSDEDRNGTIDHFAFAYAGIRSITNPNTKLTVEGSYSRVEIDTAEYVQNHRIIYEGRNREGRAIINFELESEGVKRDMFHSDPLEILVLPDRDASVTVSGLRLELRDGGSDTISYRVVSGFEESFAKFGESRKNIEIRVVNAGVE